MMRTFLLDPAWSSFRHLFVKRERLDWLAANPHYTRRFALYVGKQCRSASVKEVAEDLRLDWHAVKEMDKLYMREQAGARRGAPARR